MMKKQISRNTLQIIAMIAMLIDHFNSVLGLFQVIYFRTDNIMLAARCTDLLYGIGRMAFPIFAFLIVDGCIHTRDIRKYAFRLGIAAFVSEFCFDFAFVGWSWTTPLESFRAFIAQFNAGIHNQNNVIWSLFASVLLIWAIQNFQRKTKHRVLYAIRVFLIFIILYLACMVFGAEYWEICLPMTALMYLCKQRWAKVSILGAFMYFFYGLWPILQSLRWESLQSAWETSWLANPDIGDIFWIAGVAIALILIAHYQYDATSRPRKSRLIYAFYPGHLLVLGLIRDFIRTFVI